MNADFLNKNGLKTVFSAFSALVRVQFLKLSGG